MKPGLIALSALLTLSACGADVAYVGRLHEATVSGDTTTRTTREVSVSLREGDGTLQLEGLGAPVVARRDGAHFNVEPDGEVLGGLGTVSPARLSVTVLVMKRSWPYGFTTLVFEGAPGEPGEPEMPQHVSTGSRVQHPSALSR